MAELILEVDEGYTHWVLKWVLSGKSFRLVPVDGEDYDFIPVESVRIKDELG